MLSVATSCEIVTLALAVLPNPYPDTQSRDVDVDHVVVRQLPIPDTSPSRTDGVVSNEPMPMPSPRTGVGDADGALRRESAESTGASNENSMPKSDLMFASSGPLRSST